QVWPAPSTTFAVLRFTVPAPPLIVIPDGSAMVSVPVPMIVTLELSATVSDLMDCAPVRVVILAPEPLTGLDENVTGVVPSIRFTVPLPSELSEKLETLKDPVLVFQNADAAAVVDSVRTRFDPVLSMLNAAV